MKDKITFKSYCWSVGTTSYRTQKFNLNIERQLALLKEFREFNNRFDWSRETQIDYYNFLKENEFVKGNAKRPDKDARQKTSGLVDIGLLDEKRNLTEAGDRLLKISQTKSFEDDNILELSQDSYIFFKQLLKTSNEVNGNIVRPFVVFLYIINKVKYLTKDEFRYLLPLCINENLTKYILKQMILSRRNEITYDETIISIFMDMDNYKQALELFLKGTVTEKLMSVISINRKSSKNENIYYKIYMLLKDIVLLNIDRKKELLESINRISNGKIKSSWKEYFFEKSTKSIQEFKDIPILKSKNEKYLNLEFFKCMHLFKIKATLEDYFDLNRRYFKATDVVLFKDNKIELDVLPKCYMNIVGDRLWNFAFNESVLLDKDVELDEIESCLKVDKIELYKELSKIVGKKITDQELVRKIIKAERYERFNKLIEKKFNNNVLIRLFDYFKNRSDKEIHKLVTDNADIPTIFEYILAITWYVISGKKGDVLEYMNLSLEADLLPKTHAGGGEADIVWKYEATDSYPKHTLLIEATLSDKNNQRRMEMEPVSRHLGDYLLKHDNEIAYCIFVSNFLNPNVISDFRGRKHLDYYSNDGKKSIKGMKIIPLETEEIKTFLKLNTRYEELYKLLDNIFKSDEEGYSWYQNGIVKEVNSLYSIDN